MDDSPRGVSPCLWSIIISSVIILITGITDTYAFHNDFALSWASGIHAASSALLFIVPSTPQTLLTNTTVQLAAGLMILFNTNIMALVAMVVTGCIAITALKVV